MKVLISGYYGFGNLGDEAVLAAIVAGLKERAPGLGLSVLSRRQRYNPFALIGAVSACDVLISGGGSLFQDATSSRSLWYYAGVVRLAKLFGKKVMIFAQGLGPLRRAVNRRLARSVLNQADLITLRDEESLHELRRLNVTGPKVFVTADPAFLLAPDRAKGAAVLRRSGAAEGQRLIGVALRRPVGREKINYQALAAALDKLQKKHRLEPVFLLFQEADRLAAAEVCALLKECLPLTLGPGDPAEMLNAITGLECLVGLRLHALIFAAAAGVPLLGIAYDPKVSALLQGLGQPCLGLDELDRLPEELDRLVGGQGELRQKLAARRPNLVQRAGQNFDLFLKYFGKGEVQ